MSVGVRIERLWSPISDKGDGCGGYYRISPEAKKEAAVVGGAASCKERGGDQCDVSSSQAVTTRGLLPSDPPTPNRRSEVSGPQEMGSIQQWCHRQRGKSRIRLVLLSFTSV